LSDVGNLVLTSKLLTDWALSKLHHSLQESVTSLSSSSKNLFLLAT